MSSHPYRFPDDLHNAWTRSDLELSFSTILPGDTFKQAQGGRGGAEGSVGLLVDLGPETVVRSVHHEDSGSSAVGSLGKPPSRTTCTDSISKRSDSNEWRVSNFRPIGIFILGPPYYVRQLVDLPDIGETEIEQSVSFPAILSDFPGKRMFSANASGFFEYTEAGWHAVRIETLMAD
jgi:hypothetical protein